MTYRHTIISKQRVVDDSDVDLCLACRRRKLKTLPFVRKDTGMPISQLLKAACSIVEKNILNSSDARTHPCLVSFVTKN